MDAQCAPLQRDNPTAVLLFAAVAALRFSPCYVWKRVIHKGRNLGVYPLTYQVGKIPLASQATTSRNVNIS